MTDSRQSFSLLVSAPPSSPLIPLLYHSTLTTHHSSRPPESNIFIFIHRHRRQDDGRARETLTHTSTGTLALRLAWPARLRVDGCPSTLVCHPGRQPSRAALSICCLRSSSCVRPPPPLALAQWRRQHSLLSAGRALVAPGERVHLAGRAKCDTWAHKRQSLGGTQCVCGSKCALCTALGGPSSLQAHNLRAAICNLHSAATRQR